MMRNKLIGTTKIELTNVNTGEVEVYENHNMITNALRDIFKPLGLSNSPARYFNDFVPYYEKLLGGLLCFDTKLEENPDSYYPPANANLIGCAAYGTQNNTKNTIRGGFNQTESEVNLEDRYVKYVYDFATSQANGTIASICLTSKYGGFSSYGGKDVTVINDYSIMQSICEDTLQYVHPDYTGANTCSKYSGLTIGVTEMAFLIDRNKDCMYYFKIVDNKHITITRRKTYLKSVSILDSIRVKKPLIEEISLSELEKEIPTRYVGYNYDPVTDCLYICACDNGTLKPKERVIVTEIKIDSWNVKQYEVPNTTDVNLNTEGYWRFFVTNGYLFLKACNSPFDLFKLQLSNPANVIKFKMIDGGNLYGTARFVLNGRIYFDDSGNIVSVANTHSNEIRIIELSALVKNGASNMNASITPVRNEPLLYYTDLGAYSTLGWRIMSNYLATINNLDTPITKTADKTMKITYILQEE